MLLGMWLRHDLRETDSKLRKQTEKTKKKKKKYSCGCGICTERHRVGEREKC